jgi:hypothetical protein
VLKSSQGGSKINICGLSVVFCTYPADKALIKDQNNDISESGLLTLTRDSAGNFFHLYKDDAFDRTVSLYTDGNTSPEWRLGVKNSPLDKKASPTFGYVFGKDGQVGLVGNSNNSITLSNTTDFTVKHNNVSLLKASSLTGIHLNTNSPAYPAVTINGAVAQAQPLTEWTNSAGVVLSIVDKDGNIGINRDSADYEIDVNGSGRFIYAYLTSGVYFSDGTFQSTAAKDFTGQILANRASGIAISGWADSTFNLQGVTSRGNTTTSPITAAALKVVNGGNIGSVGTADAISIASDGKVTHFQCATFSKAQKTPIKSNVDENTITFDLHESNLHTVTLGGNRILALSNPTAGQRFIIRLVQDEIGSRTVTWFSTIKWPGGLVPTLTTIANKTDVFGFICTSASNYDGYIIGYNL